MSGSLLKGWVGNLVSEFYGEMATKLLSIFSYLIACDFLLFNKKYQYIECGASCFCTLNMADA